jgi:hypothetical protein
MGRDLQLIWLALLWILLLPSHCYGIHFVGVYAGSLPGAEVSSNTSYTFPSHSLNYGYGGLVGFAMVRNLFTQVGFLYLNRGFDINTGVASSQQEVTFTTVQVPLILQYYILPSLAVGLGAYFSHGFGNYTTNVTTTPANLCYSAYGTGGYSADDYGAVASLTIKIPLLRIVSVILDGRYLYGLPNVSQQSGMTVYLRDFQALAGVQLGK